MKFKIAFLSTFVIGLLSHKACAQVGENTSSAHILHELVKLQNTSRVLYLAAHPDDENTRMISWLVNGVGAHTAYLSLTRGDGGQNLIGTELGDQLGVLRTQELMQARNIDGGEQFFTRAVDFGYSKTAEETLEIWGEKEVLGDVVWVIRKFKPDVIITRFPPDERAGHGHHTASAMLAVKAFSMAADKSAFPEQLQYVNTWQTKRIYWNASNWWNKKIDSLALVDDDYIKVEVGEYNSLLGRSYNEIASLSRTQHKSQGFGVSVDRGEVAEYLKYLDGEKSSDLFEGVSGGLERFGFKEGDKMLNDIISDFDPLHPEHSVPDLLRLKKASEAIEEKDRREYFQSQLDKVVTDCLGIHAEALSEKEMVHKGDKVNVRTEVLLRSNPGLDIRVKEMNIGDNTIKTDQSLQQNERWQENSEVVISADLSQPYWLTAPHESLFEVNDQNLIGKPENDYNIPVSLTLDVGESEIKINIPLIYKYSDRVEGEIINPVFVVPEVTGYADQSNLIFTSDESKKLGLNFHSSEPRKLDVQIEAGGWKIEPASFTIDLKENADAEKVVTIEPREKGAKTGPLKIKVNGNPLWQMEFIDYDHIEKRVTFMPVAPVLVKADVKKQGSLVGYIPGAGDKVAEAIERMGYGVEILDEEKLRNNDLSKYKAIIAGIRAYNTQAWLPAYKDVLMQYVYNGGNYIVQYNTRSRDLLSMDIGPYPFQISRERVTEEDAEARFLLPGHPVLNVPNKLTSKDFEGWVQERGLYFADDWSEEYIAPIGWNDQGEPSRDGGLLIGEYGKGAFIYTGISFFRELPVGVAGAYRLMANLISYSKTAKNEQ